MSKIILNKLFIFISIQLVILITSLLYHNKITLLYYINISFYLSAAILLCALFIYIVQTGFYDVISKSFTLAFSKYDDKKKLDDVTPLSKLITINHKPLFFHGLLVSACMIIALILYYM